MCCLGVCYLKGDFGFPQDFDKALTYLRQASHAGTHGGCIEALYMLGGLYAHGTGGVPKDDVRGACGVKKRVSISVDYLSIGPMKAFHERGLLRIYPFMTVLTGAPPQRSSCGCGRRHTDMPSRRTH